MVCVKKLIQLWYAWGLVVYYWYVVQRNFCIVVKGGVLAVE
jgi:hypothetical protein